MKKGFTLLELVLTLFIIGIIAITFIPMFNMGLQRNTSDTLTTDGVYGTQGEIDRKISTLDKDGNDTLTIKLAGITKTVRGTTLTSEINKVKLETFVPNKVE